MSQNNGPRSAIHVVSTHSAPAAIGPYSQAIVAGGVAYVSGQIPLDPATGTLVGSTAADQVAQVLTNLDAVLEAAGSHRAAILRCTIYLRDMADFAAVNEAYGSWLGEHRPARATVGVAALPKGALVEIDCIALVTNR